MINLLKKYCNAFQIQCFESQSYFENTYNAHIFTLYKYTKLKHVIKIFSSSVDNLFFFFVVYQCIVKTKKETY